MEEQEKKDLEALQSAMKAEKIRCFDTCRCILNYDDTNLKFSGHKTIESAVLSNLKYYRDKIDKLVKEHLKKYPD